MNHNLKKVICAFLLLLSINIFVLRNFHNFFHSIHCSGLIFFLSILYLVKLNIYYILIYFIFLVTLKDWVIFFDDGGVMNDNSLRGEQWKKILVEYLVPRYGGDPEVWKKANHKAVEILIREMEILRNSNLSISFSKHQEHLDKLWLEYMFRAHPIDFPPATEYSTICREIDAFVTPQVKSSYPGIIEAIKEIYSIGLPLHTASGELSVQLNGYLTGMGIRHCFSTLYGPDLINTFKGGKEYFQAIFTSEKILPSQAIIIDDSPKILTIAEDLGAKVIHSCVDKSVTHPSPFKNSYSSTDELLTIINDLIKL